MKTNTETQPSANKSWLTAGNFAWLLVYIATMAGVVGGLAVARRQALADFDSPEAQAQWQTFRDSMKRIADDPEAPIDRRVPKSEEPPTLRLLRDYFGTVVLLAWLLCSALFATLMFMIRGVIGGPKFQPRAD